MKIEDLYRVFQDSTGIATDTRTLKKGNLFFSLKGPNFNANEFALKAIELGASFAIIDDKNYQTEQTILVDDCLTCLQDLARHHRQQLNYPIIGLTGSNGKTTTKELIHSVLSVVYDVQSTQGNLNNHIGVALTILSFKLNLDYGIVEMGANHQKEIEFLCSIAQPDYGLITNFGKAHLEGFGGVEGVIKGKSELYDFIRANNKFAFINGDDAKQLKQIGQYKNTIVFGSSLHTDFKINLISSDPMVTIQFMNELVTSNLIGAYNFGNISVAVAIGAYFNMSTSDIKKGIESYQPDNNRSEILKKGSNEIILDAYNANPTSMLAALENFYKLSSNNKFLFLGDMFELGDDAAFEHQAIVDYAQSNFKNNIYLIGSNFYNTVTDKTTYKFKSFDSAKETLKAIRLNSAKLLIKGSRGMALERILEHLDFE